MTRGGRGADEGDDAVTAGTEAKHAAQGGSAQGHGSDCGCEDCPHGAACFARAGHRRARAAFGERRDALAAGQGVPEAVAHSPEASRQWVSDELTQAARTVSARGRAAGAAWLAALTRHTVTALWSGVGVLLLGQLITAIDGGWTLTRTAALLAAVVVAGRLTLAARRHRGEGGMFTPLVGEDNRLSTSRTVAAAWLLLTGYAGLLLAGLLAGTGDRAGREALLDGLALSDAAGLLTALGIALATAGWVRHTVARRVRRFAMQKVRAARPRAADLLTDDAGRGSFTDLAYVLVHAVALVFAAVALARSPEELPRLPWALVALTALVALAYLAGKYTDGGRPVILSVVRAREPGELHAPVRPGDDIEIRGSGFVPAGAQEPDRLAETVVRIGAVYVPVPLVPVPGGFSNPSDHLLTVPVPAEVDAGTLDIRVVTAAGTESGRYSITVAD
jgi:hypothetical protein